MQNKNLMSTESKAILQETSQVCAGKNRNPAQGQLLFAASKECVRESAFARAHAPCSVIESDIDVLLCVRMHVYGPHTSVREKSLSVRACVHT